MNMSPIFVSFATADSGYVDELSRLVASLKQAGLDHHTEIVKSNGSWQANVAFRPQWILKCLNRFQRPVIWLDADAVVRQHPAAFWQTGYDFMAYFYRSGRIGSGTTYWGSTPGAKQLLEEWARRTAAPFETWPEAYKRITEWHLRDAYQSLEKLTVYGLAEPYLRIYDRHSRMPAVIEHFQASRRLLHETGDQRSIPNNPLAVDCVVHDSPRFEVRFWLERLSATTGRFVISLFGGTLSDAAMSAVLKAFAEMLISHQLCEADVDLGSDRLSATDPLVCEIIARAAQSCTQARLSVVSTEHGWRLVCSLV